MNIIHTTTSLTPEFGGPVWFITANCLELARLGNQVTLVYLDFGNDFGQTRLPSHENLHYVKCKVKFRAGMRPVWVPGYRSTLLDIISEKDNLVIHDNGIWLPYSGVLHNLAHQHNIPVITSIHGMLEPWPINYRRIRKLAAWHIYQKSRLERNVLLHATTIIEAENLRKLGLNLPIAVIPSGTIIPEQASLPKPERSRKRTMLYLSRIHPKKGLLNLVKAIDYLRPSDWKVVIAGYDENNYQAIVEKAVLDAGLKDYFTFVGSVDEEQKWGLYNSADLFILPTHSENFGNVVTEALAAGTPVITTRGTPWKELIDCNRGWWVEPTVSGLIESLENAFSLDDQELKQMGKNGRMLIEEKYNWPAIAKDLNDVYQWMLKKGPQSEKILF